MWYRCVFGRTWPFQPCSRNTETCKPSTLSGYCSLNCIEGIPINKRAMTCSGLAYDTVGWQPNSNRDLGERRKMIRHIRHVLRNRPKTRVQGNCNDAVSISDARMAKKIELSLYRSAVNMEAYRNASTLSKRISSLIRASEIANSGNRCRSS